MFKMIQFWISWYKKHGAISWTTVNTTAAIKANKQALFYVEKSFCFSFENSENIYIPKFVFLYSGT